MKVASYNANSVRSRMPILLEWLKQHEPDVVGVQETKVQDVDFPKEAFEEVGYHAVFKGEKSYNGVALLSKSKPENVCFGFDDGGPKDETRLIRAEIDGLPFVNTYVPQGRAIDHIMYRYKLGWYARLKRMFEKEYAPDQPLIWLGDINIAVTPLDVTNPENKKDDPCYHADAREAFLDTCSFGFEDILRKHNPDDAIYSFFDYRLKDAVKKNIGWRIDYILATQPLADLSTSSFVDYEARKQEKPSDHTFVVAEFKSINNTL